MFKMVSRDAIREMQAAWDRIWIREGRRSIYSTVVEIIDEAGGDPEVDPAMYTTMPLEDMIDHPGGAMYDLLILKVSNWNVMGKTTFEESYWRT